MINLGLSKKEWGWLDETLAGSYSLNVRIHLLDLEGNERSDLSWRLLGGQVDVDEESEITRTVSMSLLDPEGKIQFSSESPSDSAMYMDDMIEIVHSVYVEPMREWVDIPTFTGPITRLHRDGETIEVECQGKEILGRGDLWENFTAKKGDNKVEVIRRLLTQRAGESKFNFTRSNSRLGKDWSLTAVENNAWDGAKQLARSINRQLFYNGRGIARLRSYPQNPVFTFTGGDLGTVLTTPQISFSFENMKNAVVVRGKKEKDKRVHARAVAPRSHPLSPWRLGRNEAPRYIVDLIENDNITTNKDAEDIANRRLTQHLKQDVEVTFDSMPIFYLEEGDEARLRTDGYATTFRIKQFSIPLVAGDPMSIGYNKRMPIRGKKKTKRKRGQNKR